MSTTYWRLFTPSSLTRDGSVSTRMRGSRVVFKQVQTHSGPRAIEATLEKYDQDGLFAWVARCLADGETVILHPGDSSEFPEIGSSA